MPARPLKAAAALFALSLGSASARDLTIVTLAQHKEAVS